MSYEMLTSGYLLRLFPEFEKQINEQMSFLGEELPHCIYPDVLNPFLKNFFTSPGQVQRELAERIFAFYEDMAEKGDNEVRNLLEVSLLEPLWDSRESYCGALKLMGNETEKIFKSLSAYLNVPE